MPFFANTPESLLGRSDSKNPSTTCRGITSGGRPCRRPVTTPDPASFPGSGSRPRLGRLRVDDPRDETLYCWQHKGQASLSARSSPGPGASALPVLEERTSLDTLADRLGLLDVSQRQSSRGEKSSGSGPVGPTKQYRGAGGTDLPHKSARPKASKELSFCCFRIPIEEVPPPPQQRPRPRPVPASTSAVPQPGRHKPYRGPLSSPSKSQQSLSSSSRPPGGQVRKPSTLSTSSQTAQYLSLIPHVTSPQTASLLLAELAKPISQLDEPGYIYMFWLTPETQRTKPPTDAARSLLVPPATSSMRQSVGGRRPSDVLASFAASTNDTAALGRHPGGRPDRAGRPEGSILLKIGRATNVQRRLNEWTRQCGYELSLIRYYPYISSSNPGPVNVPRKVPHSHRVERLIHIELAGLGLRAAQQGRCATCGREHREWFQVPATRYGITEVDEVIRRWVNWDEGGAP